MPTPPRRVIDGTPDRTLDRDSDRSADRAPDRRARRQVIGLAGLLALTVAAVVMPGVVSRGGRDADPRGGFRPLVPAAFEGAADPAAPAPDAVRFGRDIRPLLSDKCYHCHGPDASTRAAGLRLDTPEGLIEDLGGYAAVVPGDPDASLLMERITETDPAVMMPPPSSHKHLTGDEIELIRRWIAQGAVWEDHWSFLAVQRPEPPRVSAPGWVNNPIDAFIHRRLDAAGLTPNEEADRRTLIRRVSLDTRGLPPSPEEIDAFVQDADPDAYGRMVDRMLASPRYGEHRAHYWLDAARYGDTHGFHYDNFRSIWPYRDWVVQAFNDNMPFDQFTVEQLAGDLLPNPTQSQRVATGFNRCNPTTNEGGVILEEYEAVYAQDRVEATTGTWLGLTASCAACHDHKFDPISQREFYELTAFFRNTTQPVMDGNALDAPPVIHVYGDDQRDRAHALEAEVRDYLDRLTDAVDDAPTGVDTRWVAHDTLALRLAIDPSNGAATPRVWTPGAAAPASVDHPAGELLGQDALIIDAATSAVVGPEAAVAHDRAFTIAFWVRAPKAKLAEPVTLFGRHEAQDNGRGWRVVALPDRTIRFEFNAGPAGPQRLRVTPRGWGGGVRPGGWSHVALVYHPLDRDKVANPEFSRPALTVYVNGKIEPRANISYGRVGDFSVDQPLTLGGAAASAAPAAGQGTEPPPAAGGPAAGDRRVAINDLRLFSAALTAPDCAVLAKAIAPSDRKGVETEDALAAEDAEAAEAPETAAPDAADAPEVADAAADPPAASANAEPFDPAALSRQLTALRGLQAELSPLQAYAPVTPVMEEKPDGEPHAHILLRGLYDQKGERVTAAVPARLPPLPEGAPANRLGLARWIVAPENPLTARVAVNRFWMELFGTGLVKTAEDFGSQGEAPSHPDLLDWLADEFVASGWDMKHLYRLILTSATYRQSSFVRPELLSTDPDNRLLARGPRFRLDAEVIRDQALWLSGLLVEKIGGPPVKPSQPAGLWKTVAYVGSNTGVFKADTGSKLYRRALYTLWKRTSTPPMMAVFDAPPRENCALRRERTNTPLQALILMNDPQFVEAARHLAQRVLRAPDDDRIGLIYRLTTGKPPSDAARATLERTRQETHAVFAQAPADAAKLIAVGETPTDAALDPVELATWTMLANQVMNMDAFLNKN